MEEINEEYIKKKKDRKISKHFDIIIDDKKFKIINYLFKDYATDIKKGKKITLISKFKLPMNYHVDTTIKINYKNDNLIIKGFFISGSYGNGVNIASYSIEDMIKK